MLQLEKLGKRAGVMDAIFPASADLVQEPPPQLRGVPPRTNGTHSA
jgi:hypothetical protein